MSSEMNLQELKEYKRKIEEENAACFENTKKLNEILMARLELGSTAPKVTENTEKLKHLIEKLSKLIEEKLELSKSIDSKHLALKKLYLEHKENYFESLEAEKAKTVPLIVNDDKNMKDTPDDLQKEFLEAQAERDKALGLVKVLLATLKSSRMQSEENFSKLKYSADLMFHIMYKAEDNFLSNPQSD